MGSFNVTCGLSGLPITYGERIATVLLQRQQYDAPQHGYAITTYVNALFNPYFGIIYGEYNDYGSVENIVEDPNTAALETIFGISVESIIKVINTNDRGIYSEYGGYPKAYGLPDKCLGWKVPLDESFTKLGFTPIITNNSYEYDDYTVTIIDDFYWDISTKDSKTKRITFHNIEEGFEKAGEIMGFYPGYKRSDYNRINKLRNTSLMFMRADVIEAMKDVVVTGWDSTVERDAEFIQEWDKANIGSHSSFPFPGMEFINRSTAISPDEFEYLAVDGMREIMLDISRLFRYLTAVNRRFEPGMYGSQDYSDDYYNVISAVGQKFFAKNLNEEFDD